MIHYLGGGITFLFILNISFYSILSYLASIRTKLIFTFISLTISIKISPTYFTYLRYFYFRIKTCDLHFFIMCIIL